MTPLPNPSLNLLGRKIAFSTIVQYAGKAVQLVISAISLKIISNFLSQDGYGVYASITEYALFFSTVANLGIFGNVVRLMADRPDDGNVFLNALVLRAVTGIFFFAITVAVCILNGSGTMFVVGTALFCSGLFFDFVTSVCDGALQTNYLMGRATVALVAGRIVNLGVLFWMVRHFGGLQGAGNGGFDALQQFWVLSATMLGSLLTCGLSLFFVGQKIKLNWQIQSATMLKFFKVSLPYGVIFILNNLYFRFIPDYLAHHFLSDADFGSFNISFRISEVLSLASTFLMFSALPGLTEYIDGDHYDKALKLFKSLQKLLIGAGLVLVVVGSLIGSRVVALLTHEKYNIPQLWFVLPMMLVLAAISYGYDLVFLTLFALDEDVWFLKREFLALLFAGIFFGLTFAASSQTMQMFLIIFGAIVGESTMVVLGFMKIRKVFQGQKAVTVEET